MQKIHADNTRLYLLRYDRVSKEIIPKRASNAETRALFDVRRAINGYEEQLTTICLPQFGGGAA